jgi:hypothetical protein
MIAVDIGGSRQRRRLQFGNGGLAIPLPAALNARAGTDLRCCFDY